MNNSCFRVIQKKTHEFWVNEIEMKIRRYFLALVYVLVLSAANAQKSNNNILIRHFPVRQGIVQPFKQDVGAISDFSGFITILSRKAEVFALDSGKVLKTFFENHAKYIIVKGKDDTVITYGNLRNVFFSEGDRIKKGDKIGLIKLDSQRKYILELSFYGNSESFSYQKYLDILLSKSD